MSRAARRQYRVRFAERGAVELTGSSVEFILEVPPLAGIPVVSGTVVHPLTGGSEMRPLQITAIDRDGELIRALSSGGRWTALGRLVDIQFREDDESAEWITYGTGRCSGLDEADGPGRFRIEISDESWVARRGRLFQNADTTQLWPSGLRWRWRGLGAGAPADITRDAQQGEDYRLHLVYAGPTTEIGKDVPSELVRWISHDRNPADTPAGQAGGNYVHTRVWHQDATGVWRAWPIVAFSQVYSATPTEGSLQQASDSGSGELYVWVRRDDLSWGIPAASGEGHLFAPTAPPSSDIPLHLGVESGEHPYGNDALHPSLLFGAGAGAGYLHIADLTRRAWEELGVRYVPENLDALEADLSLPAIAPMITELIEDPQKWLEAEVWGPNMLAALRDARGRMKLADLRPPPEDADLSGLPVLNAANSKGHRWRLIGHEQMNSIVWEYDAMEQPLFPGAGNRDAFVYLREGIHGPRVRQTPGLTSFFGPVFWTFSDVSESGTTGFDLVTRKPATIGPLQSDDVDLVGVRERRFSGRAMPDPTGTEFIVDIVNRTISIQDSGRGAIWHQTALADVTYALLQAFRDGPFRGQCEIAGSLAEQLEEGDQVLIDCAGVGIPNPGPRARAGSVLALILSLTRHPAHAVVEYLVLRPENVFRCPDPADPDTWLVTSPGEAATIRIALTGLAEPGSDPLALRIRARKDAPGGQQVDLAVSLYHGLVEVAAWLEEDISDEWVIYVLELTPEQVAEITDFAFVAVEISRAGETGGVSADQRSLQISQIAA